MSLCYLLDASSDRNTVLLTVYDAGTGEVREIRDDTYKPYILSTSPLSKEDEAVIRDLGAEVSTAEKVDLFTGKVRTVTRATLEDPALVQAASRQLKFHWEDSVPYILSYVYDRGLVFGAPHKLEDGQLKPTLEVSESLRLRFQEKFSAVKGSDPRKYERLERWFALCSQPIPEVSLKRLGLAEAADYERVYLTFLLSRVANLPLPMAFTNRQVSTWIRSILHGYLRSVNILIPRSAELRRGVETRGVPGALTFPPKTGTYFGTVVTDFESLYPSMIDAYNLSYETVDCGHEECLLNKIPGTDHYVCKKKRGVYAALIGALRDLRVQWFKPLSKDKSASEEERRLSAEASRLLKLILVSCYGVTVRIHGLAQQALAESITAYGRYVLRSSWQLAEKQGLIPLYGDTDSLFLDNPSKEQVDNLIRTVKETLNLDLAVDKVYSVCVLPRAMKAYFGIGKDGTPDVKGLTAIKSNSPLFIQNVFMDCVKELVDVRNWTQFEAAKSSIREVVKKAVDILESGKVPLKDLVYTIKLHVDTSERLEEGNVYHQPYQCAVQLTDQGKQVNRGDSVSFIKVKPFSYRGKNFTVKPVELVKDFHEVNMDDYVRNLRTALSQTFKPMNLSFKEEPKTTLADFI